MGLEKEHIFRICKVGQGSKTCSYLAAGADGFECAKANPSLKLMIDQSREAGGMNAKGDNCSGPPKFQKQAK